MGPLLNYVNNSYTFPKFGIELPTLPLKSGQQDGNADTFIMHTLLQIPLVLQQEYNQN